MFLIPLLEFRANCSRRHWLCVEKATDGEDKWSDTVLISPKAVVLRFSVSRWLSTSSVLFCFMLLILKVECYSVFAEGHGFIYFFEISIILLEHVSNLLAQ